MKEDLHSPSSNLQTPKKEGITTNARIQSIESNENAHRSPLSHGSSKKSSINEKQQLSNYKQPNSIKNKQVEPEVYMMTPASLISSPACRDSANRESEYRSSIAATPNPFGTAHQQYPKNAQLQNRQHLIKTTSIEKKPFSPFSKENEEQQMCSNQDKEYKRKEQLLNGQKELMMPESIKKAFQYGMFSNNENLELGDDKDKIEVEKEEVQKDQKWEAQEHTLNIQEINANADPQSNQLMQLACEAVTQALHEDYPAAHGRLVLKRPKFIIQIGNEEDENNEEQISVDMQKRVDQKLSGLELTYQFNLERSTQKERASIKNHALENQYFPWKFERKGQNSFGVQGFGEDIDSFSPRRGRFNDIPFHYDQKQKEMSLQSLHHLNSLHLKKHPMKKPRYFGSFDDGVDTGLTMEVEGDLLGNKPTKLDQSFSRLQYGDEDEKQMEKLIQGNISTSKKQQQEFYLLSSSKKDVYANSEFSHLEQSYESFNKKRKNLDTPNFKRADFSTPSTKKKFLKMNTQGFREFDFETIDAEAAMKVAAARQSNQFMRLLEENASKKECCGCKKTKCLKLYCECFQAMRHCTNCSCFGCQNKPEHEEVRQQTIEVILSRNSKAFESKIDKNEEVLENANGQKIHIKGCNCKRSDCKKKYCECFQLGAKCTNLCKCINCKNHADYDGSNSEGPQKSDLQLHSQNLWDSQKQMSVFLSPSNEQLSKGEDDKNLILQQSSNSISSQNKKSLQLKQLSEETAKQIISQCQEKVSQYSQYEKKIQDSKIDAMKQKESSKYSIIEKECSRQKNQLDSTPIIPFNKQLLSQNIDLLEKSILNKQKTNNLLKIKGNKHYFA